MAHAKQAETSAQTVYEAGALVSRCRWWVFLACSELARQATKDDFSRPTGPACRLPRVALERMLVLDLRIDMACILENERAYACLFISVFRDIPSYLLPLHPVPQDRCAACPCNANHMCMNLLHGVCAPFTRFIAEGRWVL